MGTSEAKPSDQNTTSRWLMGLSTILSYPHTFRVYELGGGHCYNSLVVITTTI